MALAREPEHRYASVEALIAELERWKADQPVNAAPDTIFDSLMRLARRYRVAAMSVAAVLLGIAIVTSAALAVVNQARIRESASRKLAEKLAIEKTREESREVNQEMFNASSITDREV